MSWFDMPENTEEEKLLIEDVKIKLSKISKMKEIFINDFYFIPEVAADLAPEAYEQYCEYGNLTEYECVEKIVGEYNKEMD